MVDRDKVPAQPKLPHTAAQTWGSADERKKAAFAGGSSALSPGYQTRLPMWGSAVILLEAAEKCNRKAPTEHLQDAWRVLVLSDGVP